MNGFSDKAGSALFDRQPQILRVRHRRNHQNRDGAGRGEPLEQLEGLVPTELGHDDVQEDHRWRALQCQRNRLIAIGSNDGFKADALHNAREDALHPHIVINYQNGHRRILLR